MTARDPKQSVREVTPPADETPPYYIADKALFIDYVRAFNPGDQVPVEHVDRYGWYDQVHTPEHTPTLEKDGA